MSTIGLSTSGPPETVLLPESETILAELRAAIELDDEARRNAVSEVVANNPWSLFAWALLGDCGRDLIEAYAAYRIGYHRGLDALRQSGWRGSGYVRSNAPSNRGFLHALYGLGRAAAAIGETDEADRCQVFLNQLDPDFDASVLIITVAQPLLD